jgi:hypothetical protein
VQQKTSLRLIDCTPLVPNHSGVENDDLIAAADDVEALAGPNPYSSFLRKHGCRPSRNQAMAIGRLMGARVKASDGSMQPVLTKGERAAICSIKKRRKEWAQRFDNIQRAVDATAALAKNRDDPSTVFAYGRATFLGGEFLERLDSALSWLNRFAEEAHRHAKNSSTKGPTLVVDANRDHAELRHVDSENGHRVEGKMPEGNNG